MHLVRMSLIGLCTRRPILFGNVWMVMVASVAQVSLVSGTKVQNEKSGGVPDGVACGHNIVIQLRMIVSKFYVTIRVILT